uniref:Ig-like domain-containing protein n=1 Tax=Romanomermis culicivorax TaxID=13658 RepID=A0A915JG23_ROMCU
MNLKIWPSCILAILLLLNAKYCDFRRGKAAKGKKGTKNILAFSGVREYSRIGTSIQLPGAPKIVRASHFNFNFKLGYKIWLICIISGDPLPSVSWYKDGSEILMKDSVWIEAIVLEASKGIYTKIEIDPAVLGDSGIYTCMGHNNITNISKNFKVDAT